MPIDPEHPNRFYFDSPHDPPVTPPYIELATGTRLPTTDSAIRSFAAAMVRCERPNDPVGFAHFGGAGFIRQEHITALVPSEALSLDSLFNDPDSETPGVGPQLDGGSTAPGRDKNDVRVSGSSGAGP